MRSLLTLGRPRGRLCQSHLCGSSSSPSPFCLRLSVPLTLLVRFMSIHLNLIVIVALPLSTSRSFDAAYYPGCRRARN
ncbi:hypothetical protein FKP32DRAFT_1358357 [Trametes sanguinea]|nr:hypothetical protein FKP32DRAFT_1358357 [Trametes sanguinea]